LHLNIDILSLQDDYFIRRPAGKLYLIVQIKQKHLCNYNFVGTAMTLPIVIPFRPNNPKKRLESVMTQDEREELARAMLIDVTTAVIEAGCSPILLTTQEIAPIDPRITIKTLDLGLNEALNAFCEKRTGALGIVMADLALCDVHCLTRLINTSADFGIVPGKGGGTNAIYVKNAAEFKAQYYGLSCVKHITWAQQKEYSIEIIDSFKLSTDIDEPGDLVEILIHTNSHAATYLREIGLTLHSDQGRVSVKRNI
jgi:2-phospho-L-lactate guanylyltransferase